MKRDEARRLALAVLQRVAAGAASDRSLDRALRRCDLSPPDRALATALVYGVLRWRGTLDRRIADFSKRPLSRLDGAVLDALRLGVYQIEKLDRVPDHAAVDATVEAVKSHRRGAAGFVNGVLRSLLRARGTSPAAPDPETDRGGQASRERAGEGSVDAATAFENVPGWWAERWRERYGDEPAARWFAATLRASPIGLRHIPVASSGPPWSRRWPRRASRCGLRATLPGRSSSSRATRSSPSC